MADATAKVRKVGGSLMVTIPPDVAQAEDIREGTTVRLRVMKRRQDAFGSLRGLGPWEHDTDWSHD